MLRLDGLPAEPIGPCAVTIGVFDGLHLGHQSLIRRTEERAREIGGQSLVLTFRDHPDLLLRGEAPMPLRSLAQRLDGFEILGMDVAVVAEFDESLRDMSAQDFARDILVGKLGCKALILGFDSAICKDREGTVERFAELGGELGFTAERVPPQSLDGAIVSSTEIRKAIEAGDMERAHQMFGRPYALRGRVIEGKKRGRILGFPTANLVPQKLCLPPFGVYAVQVQIDGQLDAPRLPGVANLGLRPTMNDLRTPLLEIHIFDFDGDLYGHELRCLFVSRIRPERRFASREALAHRITHDCAEARRRLANL